jgi:hypothetical protein
MSSFSEIAAILRRGLELPLGLAMPAGRKYWPNAPLPADWNAPTLGPWAGIAVEFTSTEVLTAGSAPKLRYRGSLDVVLAWPRGVGEGPLLAAADLLAEQLLKQQEGFAPVKLGLVSLEPEEFEPGWLTSRFSVLWTGVEQWQNTPVALDDLGGSWGPGAGALRESLTAVVAGIPGVRVQHGNAPAELPTVATPVVYGSVLTGSEVAGNASEKPEPSRLGIYRADIVTPGDTGDGPALALADQIAARLAFSRSSRVSLGAASLVQQGRLGPNWLSSLQIPFEFIPPC